MLDIWISWQKLLLAPLRIDVDVEEFAHSPRVTCNATAALAFCDLIRPWQRFSPCNRRRLTHENGPPRKNGNAASLLFLRLASSGISSPL